MFPEEADTSAGHALPVGAGKGGARRRRLRGLDLSEGGAVFWIFSKNKFSSENRTSALLNTSHVHSSCEASAAGTHIARTHTPNFRQGM